MKKTTLTHVMQTGNGKKLQPIKRLTLLLFLSIPYWAAAQIKLPEIEPADIAKCKIEGTYVPKGEFKKMFPNFINDGVYSFNYEDVIPGKFGLDYDGFSGYNHFSSAEYPARETTTNNDLKGIGNIVVQFIGNTDSYGQISLDKDNYIYSKTALAYPTQYSLNTDVEKSYTDFNAFYKDQTTTIFQNKKVDKLILTDLATIEFPPGQVTTNDLIFQVEFIASNIWMQGKTADKFPSYALYKLVVKTPEGKVLGNYGQALFFEGSNSKFSRPWLTRYFITQKTYPVALKNLLNQFLNDKDAYIKYKIETMADANRYKNNIKEIKNVFNELNAQKQQIAYDLEALGIKITDLSNSNEAVTEDLKENNEIYNSGSEDLATLITSAIMKSSAKKEQEKNNFLINAFKQKIDNIISTEQQYKQKISFLNKSEIAFIEGTNNALNLASLHNQLAQRNTKTETEMNTQYADANNTALNNLDQRLNKALTNNGSGNANAETAAVTAQLMPNLGSVQMSSSAPCQTQANTAWRNSTEYGAYNQNPTNANASDCKAKLIELTLQYCGSKLPPDEISALKQTAASERNVAKQLRAGTLNIDLSH